MPTFAARSCFARAQFQHEQIHCPQFRHKSVARNVKYKRKVAKKCVSRWIKMKK